MPAPQTSLWINIVSDRPAGDPRGTFWALEFNSEADAFDDAMDYPREGRLSGTVYYIETVAHCIGTGIDLAAAAEWAAEARQDARDQAEDPYPASHIGKRAA